VLNMLDDLISDLPPPTQTASEDVCAKCNKSIDQGEYLEAFGKYFHSEHFTCAKCNKLLESKVFQFNNKEYCPSCYESVIEACPGCRNPILDEYIMSDGKMYHPNCLVNGNCSKCSKPIRDYAQTVSANGKDYHKTCFTCDNCSNQISESFYELGGKVLCGKCDMKKSTNQEDFCPGCQKQFLPTDSFLKIDEKTKFHSDCFNCSVCHKNILKISNPPQVRKSKDGTFSCENCFKSSLPVCDICGKVIEGKSIMAINKRLHVDCFKCSKCKKQITGQFCEENGKFICTDHK